MTKLDEDIQEIAGRIARLVHDAYRRGETDAIDRLLRAARSDLAGTERASMPTDNAADGERQPPRRRAPKGAVEALVTRSLSNGTGKTPDEIKGQAEHDHERMIARSSIRAHLRAGEEAGRYVKKGGRWYLASIPLGDRELTADPAQGRAVSDLWPNQEGQR